MECRRSINNDTIKRSVVSPFLREQRQDGLRQSPLEKVGNVLFAHIRNGLFHMSEETRTWNNPQFFLEVQARVDRLGALLTMFLECVGIHAPQERSVSAVVVFPPQDLAIDNRIGQEDVVQVPVLPFGRVR